MEGLPQSAEPGCTRLRRSASTLINPWDNGERRSNWNGRVPHPVWLSHYSYRQAIEHCLMARAYEFHGLQ